MALATALAACGPAPDAIKPVGPKPGPSTRVAATASGAPGDPPGTGTPAPVDPAAPSPAPSPAPGTSAAPGTPAPLPASPAASTHPRVVLIEAKLLNLARVTFGQNRIQLATEQAFEGPAGAALLGNNGASVISNNGGGLISDKGGSLVTDNGAGVVGNNGGALVGKTRFAATRGYALAQAAPDVTITITPKAGETQTGRRNYPDGVTKLTFQDAPATGEPTVRTVYLRDDKAYAEATERVVERYADAAKTTKVSESGSLRLYGGGKLAAKLIMRNQHGPSSRRFLTQILPGSFTVDEVTGAATHIERGDYEIEKRTAAYRYRYAAFGLIEEGTLQDMITDANGGLSIITWDPMALDDGDSTVTDLAGARVYTKRQRRVAGVVTREFDFGDGVTLALRRVDPTHYAGRLSEGGKATADVALESRPEGSAVFTVTFDEAKAHPVRIGFGLAAGTASARPSQPPDYITQVVTYAGADDAGKVDGPPLAARFKNPTAIACSRDFLTFYIADSGNHAVRRATIGGDGAFTTFAGDGTAGGRDGARAQAQFNQPAGLAVGADDTVYVADTGGHRIRAIAPDGQVTTLAGDGTAGAQDGTGAAARFERPIGLALDAAGRLYVADSGNQLLRRLETTGADRGRVTTLAGSADAAGATDGTGAAARFKGPSGLALGPDGAIYVADKDNGLIRRVSPEGVVTTIAGSADPAALGFDGPALASGLPAPAYLAFDPTGALHVTTEKDVRVLTPAGELRTLAGPGLWSIDGDAFHAGFARCAGIAVLPNGVPMIVDRHRLRWVLPPAVFLQGAGAP